MASRFPSRMDPVVVSPHAKKLGEVANESVEFCIDECLYGYGSPDTVRICFETKAEELSSIVFPGAEEAALQSLVDACSNATFRRGSKEVMDKRYRDPFELKPSKFLTSLRIAETSILGEITRWMMPEARFIRAKLYQLNVYCAPSGHYKAHIDTPASESTFGSLVVCLPTEFCGGELVVRQEGKQKRVCWGSESEPRAFPRLRPVTRIRWAAFFSDVEHEILPVTEGYRVTLTYSLHADPIRDPSPGLPSLEEVNVEPFLRELGKAMEDSSFIPEGGILGFPARHAYVCARSEGALPVHPPMLKGADKMIYRAAMSIGLTVDIRMAATARDDFRFCPRDVYLLHEPGYAYPRSLMADEFDIEGLLHQVRITEIFGGAPEESKNIFWCRENFQWIHTASQTVWGNQSATAYFYQAAAILVTIPKWGEYRQRQALRAKSISEER